MTALPRRDFELSASWQRQLFPRRGSLGAGPLSPAPGARAAVDSQIQLAGDYLTSLIAASAEDLREAATVWMGDPGSGSPLGAAVVAVTVLTKWDLDVRKAPFADAWITSRGLGFAAEAAVELLGLTLSSNAAQIVPLRPGQSFGHWWMAPQLQTVLRVRSALAVAPEQEYIEIVGRLAAHRSRHAYHRLATSLLAPTETAWVEEDVTDTVAAKDDYRAFALTQSLSTVRQLERLDAGSASSWSFRWAPVSSHAYLATMVDALGSDVLGVILRWLGEEEFDADSRRRVLAAVAQMPTEAAMTALADRIDQKFVSSALLEAADRFPGLALDVLAARGARGRLAEVLRSHVRGHRELTAERLDALPPEAAGRVRALLDEARAIVEAPQAALPPLLVSPPWLNRGKAVKPVVLTGLVCADEPTLTWREGELAAFAVPENGYVHDFHDHASWKQRAGKVTGGQAMWWEEMAFFGQAPEELARPLLAGWSPHDFIDRDDLSPIVARFGLDALPPVIRRARQSAALMAPLLLPFSSPELAVMMADWLARLKSVRATASAWLLRHPEPAARALVPVALDRAGAARRQAENALLHLGTRGQGEAVLAAARTYGTEAAVAIEHLLGRDPLTVLPAKVPALPAWGQTGLLPPVRLRDGSGALPGPAMEHLVTIFALSRLDQPYPGLDVVRDVVQPEDLSAFAWDLFQRWYASGAVAKDNWVLDGLALAGDDEVVRRLSPLILAWPGEGGHARAVTGVNVLAAIGSDVALMHLHNIAQRAKFKGLKTTAQQKMATVADSLGFTSEQLADRLVPGLGLQADGSMVLDYGPRQFVVGFDEHLRPYGADATGQRLKNLPKPGAKDDPELAPAAYQQFSALKKDVRKIGADVVRRLEQAMVNGRRWSGAEFRQLFVDHPLQWHVVRRLVWGLHDSEGNLIGSLRVAEDRTFADVSDDETAVADDAVVGVVHPLHLGDAVAAWSEVFADYEILQPFAQLARTVYTLSPQEAETGSLERFEGVKIPTTKVLGLERRGWRRDDPMDAGIQGSIEVSFTSGVGCGISLDPGIIVGDPNDWEEQTLAHVWLSNSSAWACGQTRATGSRLPLRPSDLVAVSEILRDLTDITDITEQAS
ncbi:DUF4132 domain-containing protein [Kineosporia sp. NBRC 101731]|uniref:DUF4132 domain-containing protein n=1 Tax=Kineosporia sp. NBRC 101731 TaxID=3032199 RepID=UPI0024A2C6DB|nr:DUF4132 domain-containing protein [Kineosporia sp. NBRC 101731]GLY32643.1 hypothetical protein Kisp02_60080 [Kineosporia sp. NBRC 101731]